MSDAGSAAVDFLKDGGEMGERMRAFDWASHPLGSPESWPQALRTAVGLMLTTRHPVFIFWSADLYCFYNDAYAGLIGPEKHPAMLGARGQDMWREVWSIIRPQIDLVMAGAGATWHEHQPVSIIRHGKLDESYWTYSQSPIDHEGGVGGVLVLCTETTQLVLAGQRERAQLDRLREALEDAPSYVVIVSGPEHRVEFVNEACRRLIGGRDAIGKTAREVVPEIQGFWSLLDTVYRTGHSYVRRSRRGMLKGADGQPHEFFVDIIYQPMRDASGAVNGVFVQGYDVTEGVRANEALRRSERRLEAAVAERTSALQQSEARVRTIFESSHSFQGLLTPEGVLLDANTTALEAIRGTRSDVVGKLFWDTPWFTGTPGMPEQVRAAIEAGAVEAPNTTLNLPTGVRSFDFSMRSVKDEAGEVIALVPEAVEITARLKAEQALRQAQALEAVGQLTGGVAHDFNNLLMVVAGGLTLMERRDDPERRQILIARMREAVDRGATLTKQLLAFSRKYELAPQVVDFADHLSGMRELLDRSLGANLRVAVETAEGLAPIFVDPTALQLALLNLAVNARDAMPDGGTVTIKAANGAPDDPGAPFVSISVVDSGVGMTPEVQEHMFEPFYTTKEIGKGSGLGLAQVHGFVQQSGGRVEVRSAPGAGATVTLILPASDSSDRPVAKPAAVLRAERAKHAAGDVLLVEDNHEVAALTREMLERLGWQVTQVASAEAALGALANARKIDLIFSDVMLPGGMNGLDLAREARRRRPGIPVVLTSGYAESIKRDAEQAGLPLLPKPFDLDTLAATLDVAQLR